MKFRNFKAFYRFEGYVVEELSCEEVGAQIKLRFDPEEPGKPKQFSLPAMDTHYNGVPSMISETTWCRPNRYCGEAPLYYAAYGALQHTDAIVHFALDSSHWAEKPGFSCNNGRSCPPP